MMMRKMTKGHLPQCEHTRSLRTTIYVKEKDESNCSISSSKWQRRRIMGWSRFSIQILCFAPHTHTGFGRMLASGDQLNITHPMLIGRRKKSNSDKTNTSASVPASTPFITACVRQAFFLLHSVLIRIHTLYLCNNGRISKQIGICVYRSFFYWTSFKLRTM